MKDFPQQAIVLAAGLGTRLRPLTQKVPKPILPIGGVPIVLFNLYLLKEVGIFDITINLHHLAQKIRTLLGDGKALGVKLHYSYEPKILGTAGGIAKALKTMRSATTFVLNGDILTDLDFKALFETHQRHLAKASLACVSQEETSITSFVESDQEGRIHKIAGEPLLKNSPTVLDKYIFTGIHCLEPEIFNEYPRGSMGCVVRKIYQKLLTDGQRLQMYPHKGYWKDLGTLEELKQIDEAIFKKEAPKKILELWDEVRNWSKIIL